MLLGLLVIGKAEVYIVTIEGEPVTSYKGSVNGFEATVVEDDEKLDVTSDLVISYSQHLEQRHDTDTLLETLFDDGMYQKLYSYKHLINGFAVHVSSEQAEMLRRAPGVKYLIMNGVFSLGGTVSPKSVASSAILYRTLRRSSPTLMPEIIFSNICQSKYTDTFYRNVTKEFLKSTSTDEKKNKSMNVLDNASNLLTNFLSGGSIGSMPIAEGPLKHLQCIMTRPLISKWSGTY